ncbi:MAG: TIGR04283 family arsenosugar biosynthesis glycosyltransferase [Oscillatoriales cyanobacterium C42_A2020_001]|nr:TIGR04283 family arsenosugar biosynthesis glycosyltransferase [Leptolyngbyaceae cyanobacterium C42_A2020_001]
MAKISVIVPVLNEAASLPATLNAIAPNSEIEVIVADGGSQDGSVEIAKRFGVCLLTSAPGRATQMNAGAAIARGDVLLFLHADTHLPPNYATLIDQTLAQPNVVAGAFDLKINGTRWGLRVVEWGVAVRSRFCQLPYGDQALFLKTERFQELNGYPDLPFMEDFVFIRQLKQVGKVAIAPAAVMTSGRRWHRLGIVKTTLINQFMVLGYLAGIPPSRLVRWYRSLR